LAPEQAFVLEADPRRARALARKHLEPYLRFDNYRQSWLRQGFGDSDLAGAGSDRLVDKLVAWGDEPRVCAHVERHFEAGASHVAVQAIGPNPLEQLRRLAAAIGL
jgi:probable F420-dependent oxidoreductase